MESTPNKLKNIQEYNLTCFWKLGGQLSDQIPKYLWQTQWISKEIRRLEISLLNESGQ